MEFLDQYQQSYIKCRQRVPPPPVVRDGPPAGPGGGGKMCSGAWKRGPESPVEVISLWCGSISVQGTS